MSGTCARRARLPRVSWTAAGGMVDLGTLGGTQSIAVADQRRRPRRRAGKRDERQRDTTPPRGRRRRHRSTSERSDGTYALAKPSTASGQVVGDEPDRTRERRLSRVLLDTERTAWSRSAPSRQLQPPSRREHPRPGRGCKHECSVQRTRSPGREPGGLIDLGTFGGAAAAARPASNADGQVSAWSDDQLRTGLTQRLWELVPAPTDDIPPNAPTATAEPRARLLRRRRLGSGTAVTVSFHDNGDPDGPEGAASGVDPASIPRRSRSRPTARTPRAAR